MDTLLFLVVVLDFSQVTLQLFVQMPLVVMVIFELKVEGGCIFDAQVFSPLLQVFYY
jgi:hypothetical protein